MTTILIIILFLFVIYLYFRISYVRDNLIHLMKTGANRKRSRKLIGINYLHNHPTQEKLFGIDSEHVIVDRNEWEDVISYFRKHPEEFKKVVE